MILLLVAARYYDAKLLGPKLRCHTRDLRLLLLHPTVHR